MKFPGLNSPILQRKKERKKKRKRGFLEKLILKLGIKRKAGYEFLKGEEKKYSIMGEYQVQRH